MEKSSIGPTYADAISESEAGLQTEQPLPPGFKINPVHPSFIFSLL